MSSCRKRRICWPNRGVHFDPNKCDFKKSRLHFECEKIDENVNELNALLKQGHNINVQDLRGMTPLHVAVMNSREKVADFLLSKGANINIATNNNETPIFFACLHGLKNMVDILLKYKADLNIRTEDFGWYPIHAASSCGDIETITTILNPITVNLTTKSRETPLHLALNPGKNDFIELLLQHGADPNARTVYSDCSPLHLAISRNLKSIVEMLLSYGADINVFREFPLRTSLVNKDDLANLIFDFHSHCINTIAEIFGCIFKLSPRSYILCRNIMKYRAVNLIDNRFEDNISSQYKDECEDEVKKLKLEKISNSNISYFDFVIKDYYYLAKVLKNKEISKTDFSSITKKFPIYGHCMFINSKKSYHRLVLCNSSFKYLHQLSDFKLPVLCIDIILSYLSNMDMENFVDAFSLKKTYTTIKI